MTEHGGIRPFAPDSGALRRKAFADDPAYDLRTQGGGVSPINATQGTLGCRSSDQPYGWWCELPARSGPRLSRVTERALAADSRGHGALWSCPA